MPVSGTSSVSVQINVIGLGVETGVRLSEPAELALLASHTVIGSPRQLALARSMLNAEQLSDHGFLELPKLSELKLMIERLGPGTISILASGDPLYFGIGRWLMQKFDVGQLHFYASVSSIQAVCNRLGLAQQDCRVVSFHGRDLAGIRRDLKQNTTLILLTDKHSHPRALAEACVAAGFSESTIWVCEDIGSEHERYRVFDVVSLCQDVKFECSDLHVCVIQTRGRGGVLPEFPGIPDTSFVTDAASGQGMISKREVRLAILSLMQPGNGDLIWDIGAGCGGVATELAYWNRDVTVYAIEQHPQRLKCLEENQQRFGTIGNLRIVDGRAPQALGDLPDANKVFIGGNDGELESILQAVWQKLPENGLLVASSVTDKTLQQLKAFALASGDDQVESAQIAVSKGEVSDGAMDYQPKLPVTLFKFIKRGQQI
jgi:precorrin-6Y C5,15-methyltransferase (decarboxylating)